ncbi:MAG: DUF58 domain-containing protein [Spirochaetes bacterium]|nr:DUF58 domain-containing protein [Spirochaetota bacterium]
MKIGIYKLPALLLFPLSVLVLFQSSHLLLQFLATTIICFLLFYSFYFFILFLQTKKNRSIITSFDNRLIHPFQECQIVIAGNYLPVQSIGLFITLYFDLYQDHEKIETKKYHLYQSPPQHWYFDFCYDRHGFFQLKNFRFVIQDIFGLTQFTLSVDFEYLLNIYPFFLNEIKIPLQLKKGGEEVLQSIEKIDSTDFFENRKYYPGDDPRRINWKIFAHSDELHIREVEKIPPQIGELSLIFAPHSKSIFEYEYISALFFTTIHYFLQLQLSMKILAPPFTQFISIDNHSEKKFNHIMNHSYHPFHGHNTVRTKTQKSSLLFTTSEELEKFLVQKMIDKNTYCIVAAENFQQKTFNFKKKWYKIIDHDNLFMDYYKSKQQMQHQKKRLQHYEHLKNIAQYQNIELNWFYTEGPEFAKSKHH